MMLRETRTHAIVPDSLTAFKYISAFKKFAINNGNCNGEKVSPKKK